MPPTVQKAATLPGKIPEGRLLLMERATTVDLKDNNNNIILESLILVGAAVAVAAVATGASCVSHSVCIADGTCVTTTHNATQWLPKCSFRTVVPLTSDLIYTNSSTDSLVRGYCGVGERLQLRSGNVQCGTFYPYPDALNYEIMDQKASTDSYRACGKWLGSGLSLSGNAEYFSFSGTDDRMAAVRAASVAGSAGSLLSSGNIGKLRGACHRAVLGGNGALRAAGKLAYDHLISQLPFVNDTDSLLAATGVLIGHYCDGPIVVGYDYSSSNSAPLAFVTTVYGGAIFSADAMAQALELVEESHATIAAAEAANARVNALATVVAARPFAAMERLIEGATGRLDHENVVLSHGSTPQLDGLYALAEVDLQAATFYLKGVAAMCSFSMQSTIDSMGYTARGAAARDLQARRAAKPIAAALGRLKPKPGAEPLAELDHVTMRDATSVTFSQLAPLVGSEFADTEGSCLGFAQALFPDEFDQEEFRVVVTPTLYTKLEAVTETVRAAVVSTLQNNAVIRATMVNPNLVAAAVQQVRLRIPGAPRGSWAGSTREVPKAEFDSSDGVYGMAAKQARAVFLDRQANLVFDATHVCEGPPAFDALGANAYIYPLKGCSYYLLGMALRPFADENYDDESLYSKFGYIFSHEFAHVTLKTKFVNPAYEQLLVSYPDPNTYPEAIADVIAGLALVEAGLVNSSILCAHMAQTWCARTPPMYYMGSSTHPKANVRGDSFCATLRNLGV